MTNNTILTISVIVFIICCFFVFSPTIEGWKINQCADICKDDDGVSYYSNFTGYVTCGNGRVYSIKKRPGIQK